MSKDQLAVTAGGEAGSRRRRYSEAERRRVVEETYAPGASVSMVARRHDVNANLVFKWRQRYGEREDKPAVEFLPVAVEAHLAPGETEAKRRRVRKAAVAAFIEIEFSGGHRLRVHGAADERTVRSIIEALSR